MDRKFVPALIVILAALFLFSILLVYYLEGPPWDIIVHYLDAKAWLNPVFLSKDFVNINGWEIQYNTLYAEPLREAMPALIFVPLILLTSNPILYYLIALYIIFIACVYAFGRYLKLDTLLLYSLMLNPFFVYFSFAINGTEVLSFSFMLVALGLLFKKSRLSGLFMGLAGLSKYPALIFLPMLLFLKDKKKIAVAFLLFFIVTLPWLVFNYIFYGNPLEPYIASITFNVANGAPIAFQIVPVLIAIAFPVVLLVAGLLHIRPREAGESIYSAFFEDKFTKIALVFTVLAILSYIVIAQHADYFDQIRYAYFICGAATILALLILQQASLKSKRVVDYTVLFSIIILISLMLICYYVFYSSHVGVDNLNSSNSTVKQGIDELSALNYSGCRVVSNAWVEMIYLNQSAYSPLFLNATVATEYPIIAFKNTGIAESYLWNIKDSNMIYNNSQFSIFLPLNASCIKD